MKFTKFFIPVGISLAAFIWGYQGELWLGRIDPNIGSVNLSPSEIVDKSPKILPQTQPAPANRSLPGAPTLTEPILTNPPIKARELPLSTGGESEEYAPEDDGQSLDEDSAEIESDPEEDQALTEDEGEADNSENEEVDSNSNEGDLEGDETADTAETKPVKP